MSFPISRITLCRRGGHTASQVIPVARQEPLGHSSRRRTTGYRAKAATECKHDSLSAMKRSPSLSKKGMFDMAAPLAFFVLLLVFSMIILMLQADKLKVTRPEMTEDLRNQLTAAFLTSMLRSDGPGYAGDGSHAPIGELIALDASGTYDDAILGALKANIPDDVFFRMEVSYPNRRVTFMDVKTTLFEGHAEMMLPTTGGTVKIVFYYSDARLLNSDYVAQAGLRPSNSDPDWLKKLIAQRVFTMTKDATATAATPSTSGATTTSEQARSVDIGVEAQS